MLVDRFRPGRYDVIGAVVCLGVKAPSRAALNLDRQRALIDTLMMVELLRAPRGRKGFDPDTVRITWRRSRADSEWGLCSFLARQSPA